MSETNGQPTGIYQKIAEVLGAMEDIPKTGTNPHFGYAFHEEQVIVEHLRPLLAEKGVVLVVRQGERTIEKTEKGGKVVVAPTDVTFVDADDGSSFTARVWGEGQDTQDKGSHKALVGAFKYALMKTFLISAGNDDIEGEKRQRGNGRKRGGVDRTTGEVDGPECPKCDGPVWDNRDKKASGEFNPKSPDFACRDKDGCGWTLWLDSTRDKLQGMLKSAKEYGHITDEQYTQNSESVDAAAEAGDIDQLRATTTWIRSLGSEEQKEGAPA